MFKMMRFQLLSVSCLILLLGCTPEPADQMKTSHPTNEKKNGSESGENNNMGSNELTYHQIKAEEAPPEIQKQLDSLVKKGGHISHFTSDHIYIAISLGPRKSSGYRIKINKIEKKNRQATIHATETTPKPDEFVTQVITYPFIILSIPRDAIEKVNVHLSQNNYSQPNEKKVK
ncbi:protease complex subunit PrcB family protein [Thermoflavimicrobium dichotomicum]|uniref:PrcB C-terminal n=1 Tax=Thermoflavimicrobium dichotomicum TaxID=46223 RepID=A0A1I3MPR7_9BACL|nr:protease complex subunit PrcB family protein [Thermoflavimicrobium dichotomicum]SFI98973.1 PrcB C-terminal [Thermoflavimicrobium dichotomicum]